MDKYDYIELVIYDVHAIPRGRMVARRRIMSALKKGIGMYSAMCFFGIRDEPNVTDYFGLNRNYGNGCMVPILDTLVDAPKCAWGENKVGQVLCELRLLDGTLEPSTPRQVAQRQIEKLASIGFTIRSAHEIEFAIIDNDDRKLWGHDAKWGNMNVIGDNGDLWLELLNELSNSGVKVDTLQTEAGPGQFELTLDIAEGLKGPDMTCRFKSISKLFFKKPNLNATFMTKIQYDGLSNGFHFNHSLWTKDGINAFLDVGEPNRLSAFGRHWLAGLITHAPALTALCCPTVNCYRRLHNPWTPSKANWAVQNRLSCFRLVIESDNNIYIECRLPSSACNSYIVMAAITAAGLDGVSRQLSLEDVNQEVELPHDLEEALRVLEDDAIIVESLGKEFIDCFTSVKRTHEIKHFKKEEAYGDSNQFLSEIEIYGSQL